MRLYLIAAAALLAALAWHSYVAKQLKTAKAELQAAHTTIAEKDALIAIERADRRRSDASVTELQARLDARHNEPPITGVRCRSARVVPAEGRAAASANAAAAGVVEGLPAGDSGGQGPDEERDVSVGLNWYATACGKAVETLAALQAWEAGRAH